MDIFFTNPDDVPVPPEKMEIRTRTANPYEDGRRVAIAFEITPFQQRPNIEITVTNKDEILVSTFSVVEAIENRMSFTLHLRESKPRGTYKLDMQVFYTDMTSLEEGGDDSVIKDILLENKQVVAEAQTTFEVKS
jgi:hypothetical protein